MKEYSAHLLPEGGIQALPQIYGDGWMIVGDSAGFEQRSTGKAPTLQ